jgi:uncharacterized membrane protein
MHHAPRTTHHAIRSTQHAVLLIILLLSFALRVYRLDAQSLWYDEAVTAQVAAKGIAELTRWTAEDIQPPLYYYAVAGWTRLAGRSEWALRFPSAFFGVLTVALLWVAARRLLGGEAGRWAAGIAAWLAATSPLYVYYAQEARMYTLLTFWGVLAGYALLRVGQIANRKSQIANRKSQIAESITQYAIRNTQYAIRNTQYAIRNTHHASRITHHASRWWLIFVLASTAMLYTHYFGAFLLAAYGVCLVLTPFGPSSSENSGPPHRNRGFSWFLPLTIRPAKASNPDGPIFARGGRGMRPLLAFLAIALLYLPWLPAMLTRYRVDASYWQGALKLDEALRHVALSFTTAAPEMMLESLGMRLLPAYGAAFVMAVAMLFWRRRHSGAVLTLLAVLIIPIVAVLILASRTPKFNPRYLMLASPAFLLLLAGGLAAGILESGTWHQKQKSMFQRQQSSGARAAGLTWGEKVRSQVSLLWGWLVVLVFGLVVFAFPGRAIDSWFTDPAFTKSQWRELTAYVRQERGADEAVLLVSGHAYPAWDYYAADIPVVRLPEIDILDVNATLGFEIGPALTEALADRRGVWLVTWQDEVVDPAGFLPYFLARGGRELPVSRRFWGLGLRHWQLAPGATYPAEPQPQHVQGANFDHKLALLGWDDPQQGKITVYWRTLNTLSADYQVSLILEDAQSHEIGRWDGRPAGYDYPTTRWRVGQAVFGRYPLPLSTVTAAGDYYVALAVYAAAEPSGLDIRDVADNPAGKRVRLGPMRVDAGR